MKIAMIGVKSVPCPGGIATYTEQLGSRPAARGHEVTVYCRRQYLNGDTGSPIAPYRGMQRRLSPGIPGKYTDAATHTLTAAIDALRSDFDIIHIHGSAPAFVAPLLSLKRRSPTVVTIHSLDWEGAKWGAAATGIMRPPRGCPFGRPMNLLLSPGDCSGTMRRCSAARPPTSPEVRRWPRYVRLTRSAGAGVSNRTGTFSSLVA